ncbi:hypothetical protein Ancab_005580 [Ancistrocladus abbreviatus]
MKSPTTVLCHQQHPFFIGTPIFMRKPLASLCQPPNTAKTTIHMTIREDGLSLTLNKITKAIGQELLLVLLEQSFPCHPVLMLASERSTDKHLSLRGEYYVIIELTIDSFEGINIALLSTNKSISKQFGIIVMEEGLMVVDNS